ncbi:MAG: hypothetical protein HY222_01430 [Thaumarchaeota archaeon]|nr:hypothetical protein [Nitrososphaerota archaeon]MBI3641036.1 hypothetical protein [Nitrososphaerota archaeon]
MHRAYSSHHEVCGGQRGHVCYGQNLSLWIVSRCRIRMTDGEKTSKLKEIKETVSGAVEIMHQIRSPGVQESFGNIMDTAKIVKEIIEVLKTPEMVKNIENCRMISENMNEVTTKMQNTLKHLEETGTITEAKGLIKSAKNTMDSFSGSGQDLHEMSNSIKEMFKSIRALVDELRITVVS